MTAAQKAKQNGAAPQGVNVTIQDLLMKIGALVMELEVAHAQIASLQAER